MDLRNGIQLLYITFTRHNPRSDVCPSRRHHSAAGVRAYFTQRGRYACLIGFFGRAVGPFTGGSLSVQSRQSPLWLRARSVTGPAPGARPSVP
ncbi:hypothetical protein EVAR_33056_1 [Eumeta japonica]|uniref:Uncharacterized protein n=1 Tax=Eumeta variegata TaxID=151549 RepID=A0A4C1WWU4_EUMVA|nr:hypothetical protein EVAR_33056_1 [Eumeta japonica]